MVQPDPPLTGPRHIASADARRAARAYDRLIATRALVIVVLAAGAAGAFLIDIATGPSSLALADVWRALITPDQVGRANATIVWQVRLPAAIMAVLVGAALAVAGAEMQTIFNNPMASPFTLGLSSAATLGAGLAIVLGLSLPGLPASWAISANAFVFAFLSALLLQTLARLRGSSGESMLLFGIALFFTFNALVALMQFLASEQALQQLVFWTLGSLSRATWDSVRVLALVLAVVLPLSFLSSWKLTALRLGEERALSFGVAVGRLRLMSLLRISVLTGVAVAFVGVIGFVGLVAPHIARMLTGEDHRFLLPASALTGIVVMSLASTASKIIAPGALVPIGIVTALIGIPVFLTLVLTQRDRL